MPEILIISLYNHVIELLLIKMNSRFYSVEIFIDNAYAMNICTSFGYSYKFSENALSWFLSLWSNSDPLQYKKNTAEFYCIYDLPIHTQWLGRIDVIYVAAFFISAYALLCKVLMAVLDAPALLHGFRAKFTSKFEFFQYAVWV